MREPWDDPIATLARAGMPSPLVRPPGPPDAAGDAADDAFGPLWQASAAWRPAVPPALRRRLFTRVTVSAEGARGLHTRRHADTVAAEAGPGVTLRPLYRTSGTPRRPGEPEAVSLVELMPGAAWAGPSAPGATLQRECLVLRGSLSIGAAGLQAHDYHVVPAGVDVGTQVSAGVRAGVGAAIDGEGWSTRTGALVYLRESQPAHGAPNRPVTLRADQAEWADYAPGIKRRVMWRQGAQAAMLYHALPGAAVPHHGHHHDEECLMLAGDFFLDEVLLRTLDYQIAPAGTEHRVASTDTGVVIYAHGDADLDVK